MRNAMIAMAGQEMNLAMLTQMTGNQTAQGMTAGDPFSQMVQQMIAQMNGESSAPGVVMPQTEESTDESDILAEFAAMLQSNPTMMNRDVCNKLLAALENTADPEMAVDSVMQEGDVSDVSEVIDASGVNNASGAIDASGVSNASAPNLEATVETVAKAVAGEKTVAETVGKALDVVGAQTQGSKTAAAQPTKEAQASPLGKVEINTETKVETTAQPQSGETKQNFQESQRQFLNAVGMAKRNMKEGIEPTESTETIEFNGEVISEKTQPTFESIAKKVETIADAPKLLEQLKTGLTANKQNSEFTMKLRPDALGEITVRLVHEDGKAVLHIVTASTNTTRMINDDLAALREAVRPMQIEVREAVSTTSESGDAQMGQSDMSGQQFNMSGQQFANRENHTPRNKVNEGYDEETILEDAEDIKTPELDTNNLSVYI